MRKRSILLTAVLLIAVGIPSWAGTLKASWYSLESLKKEGTFKASKGIMANGKMFNEDAMTCACRLYPLGAVLEITNTDNGKTVQVKVTDRIGKRFAETRIDLSKAAFAKIAKLEKGIVPITARRVK